MVVGVPQGPRAEPRHDPSFSMGIGRKPGLQFADFVRGTCSEIHVEPKTDLVGRPALTALESTESPHSIALHVATVRYCVEEKRAVTCDDAQTPWSLDRRVLLCKLGRRFESGRLHE